MRKIGMEIFLFSLLAALVLTGCASTGQGSTAGYESLIPDAQADRDLHHYRIRPNYTYYYSGADEYPNAVIGVDNRYVLVSDLWKKVDLTPEKMKDWVDNLIARGTIATSGMLHGYNIINADGAALGIWYSIIQATPRISIRMKGDNEFDLDTPPVDLYTTQGAGGGASIQLPARR